MEPTCHRGSLRRSALVGVAATLSDLALLAALVDLGVAAAAANVPALSVGLAVQFAGNKLWAFQNRDVDARVLARQGSTFLAVELVALGLNAAAFHVLAVGFDAPPMPARVAASALVYFGFSYRLWAWIFRPAPPVATGERR